MPTCDAYLAEGIVSEADGAPHGQVSFGICVAAVNGPGYPSER